MSGQFFCYLQTMSITTNEQTLKRLLNDRLLMVFGGNATAFAGAIGTSQQNVSNFLSLKVLKPNYWLRAVKALQIDPEEYLLYVDGVKAERSTEDHAWVDAARSLPFRSRPLRQQFRKTTGVDAHDPSDLVPVLGRAAGGSDGMYVFNGEVIDLVQRPPSLANVPDAYAVYVDGESMSPRYRPGETVWVHPNKPVRFGDDVVVQIKIHDLFSADVPHAYIKEYCGWNGDTLRLRQYNPKKEIPIERDDVISVHPIVFASRY